MLRAVVGLALLSFSLVGCVFPPLDLSDRVCAIDSECAPGFSCVASHCVIGGADAGPPADAAIDAAVVCTPICTPYEDCTASGCVLRPTDLARRGTPASVNTLTVPDVGATSFTVADIAMTYPGVDLTTLERIYIRAGDYTSCTFTGLPERSHDHPLVITNSGGRVRCHDLAINGGTGIVLTGRYDATTITGDLGFVGHANGFAGASGGDPGTAGEYGIVVTHSLHVLDTMTSTLSDVEIEYVEILDTVDDASGDDYMVTVLNQHHDLTDVDVHDIYMHDIRGPFHVDADNEFQFVTSRIAIHDSRFVRSDYEAVRVDNTNGPVVIARNTMAMGTSGWRRHGPYTVDAPIFLGAQAQAAARVQDNAVLGSHAALVHVEGRHIMGVTGTPLAFVTHNLMIDAGGPFVVWSDQVDSQMIGTAIGNVFRDVHDGGLPGDGAPPSPSQAPHYPAAPNDSIALVLRGERWQAMGMTRAAPMSYTLTQIDESDEMTATLEAPRYGTIGEIASIGTIEHWFATGMRGADASGNVTYSMGQRVWYQGAMYTAMADVPTGMPPGSTPEWSAATTLDDDFELQNDAYAGIGARAP